MLVLSRSINEEIQIGPEIRLKILRVTSTGVVKIGISAPGWYQITRPEAHGEQTTDEIQCRESLSKERERRLRSNE